MSQAKRLSHLSLPFEVHFFPHHGRYDLTSILPSGVPFFLSGVRYRRWWGGDPFNAFEEVDPWEVRTHLLNDDGVDFEEFTYEYGRFGDGHFSELRIDRHLYKGTRLSAEIGMSHDFREWRDLLSIAITTPMSEWCDLAERFPKRKVARLRQPPSIGLHWHGGEPISIVTPTSSLGAVLASIYIDKLNAIEFRLCARPDCGKPFQLNSGHQRIYCDEECGHYVANKNWQQRQRQQRSAASSRLARRNAK